MTTMPPAAGAATAAPQKTLLREGRVAADRLLGWLLLAHLPVALALAFWHGTYISAVLVGVPAAVIPFVASRRAPGLPLVRFLIATALMTFSALFIWQGQGMIEMHFHVFAGLAFLVIYRDWRVPLWGAVVIAVHHLVFSVLQQSGMTGAVFANE